MREERMGSDETIRTEVLSDGDESPIEDDPKNPLRFAT
jgi:hypothetical protein